MKKMNFKLLLLVVLIAGFSGQAVWARTAPDFSLPDADGKLVRLSSYRGKYVIVDIMLTTCPHCQVAGKVLEKLFKENSKQLMVISVATDPSQSLMMLDMYRKTYGFTYPVVMGNWKVFNDYLGVTPGANFHVPSFFFIDPSGEIIEERSPDRPADKDWMANTEQNLEETVKKILPPEKPAAKSGKTSGPAKKRATAKKQP